MSIWADINRRSQGHQQRKEDSPKADWWMGIPGIRMIWHGITADPELEYKGITRPYYEIEYVIYDRCKEEHGELKANDDKYFMKYCQKHADEIKELF